jgi:multiple sugar transport system substrate-binding protein
MLGYERLYQLLLDLKTDGALFPGTEVLRNDALRAHFAEGKIGMFMGEFWDVGVLNYQFPAKCHWGVAPIPTYDGKFHGKPRAMMLGGLWYVNGKSRYKTKAWEVIKWFSQYKVRAALYEDSMCIDPDPNVLKYVKKRPTVRGFASFAETLNHDYLATYPNLPGWIPPTDNPCTVFRKVLTQGKDLSTELQRLEISWNRKLEQYFSEHPDTKREWNTYPQFNRETGSMGSPLVKPIFRD